LAAYQIGLWLYQRSAQNPIANPVAIAVVLVSVVTELLQMPYRTYFEGAQFVHFLLGSATVSLAIPIYRGIQHLQSRALPLIISLVCGGLVSILGADQTLVGGLYSKSVTAPIAMGIAEQIGISPTLTAVFAVVTGILGAVLARFILDALGMKSWWQRGFAIGVASHGIGASRAFSVSPEAGAYASLAMGMHGILGAIAIPWIFHLMNR
jgi:putative effector of murein hydrolase